MVTGLTGIAGRHVPNHVLVALKAEQELAVTPPHWVMELLVPDLGVKMWLVTHKAVLVIIVMYLLCK